MEIMILVIATICYLVHVSNKYSTGDNRDELYYERVGDMKVSKKKKDYFWEAHFENAEETLQNRAESLGVPKDFKFGYVDEFYKSTFNENRDLFIERAKKEFEANLEKSANNLLACYKKECDTLEKLRYARMEFEKCYTRQATSMAQ